MLRLMARTTRITATGLFISSHMGTLQFGVSTAEALEVGDTGGVWTAFHCVQQALVTCLSQRPFWTHSPLLGSTISTVLTYPS